MNNPMSYDWVRVAYDAYSEEIQRVLDAVGQFAYDAPWPIETKLGEYSGKNFNKDSLVAAVNVSISATDENARGYYGSLKYFFEKAGLPDTAIKKVQRITEQVALDWIQKGIYKDADGQERISVHGHHARQYISRDVVALVIKDPEICPQ